MAIDRYDEIIEEIVEDLELHAGIILTSTQLLTLWRTQQIRFNNGILNDEAISGVRSYLRDTLPEERVWDAYRSLSDNSLVFAIRPVTQYVTVMLV
jgi:hypothetical protein